MRMRCGFIGCPCDATRAPRQPPRRGGERGRLLEPMTGLSRRCSGERRARVPGRSSSCRPRHRSSTQSCATTWRRNRRAKPAKQPCSQLSALPPGPAGFREQRSAGRLPLPVRASAGDAHAGGSAAQLWTGPPAPREIRAPSWRCSRRGAARMQHEVPPLAALMVRAQCGCERLVQSSVGSALTPAAARAGGAVPPMPQRAGGQPVRLLLQPGRARPLRRRCALGRRARRHTGPG